MSTKESHPDYSRDETGAHVSLHRTVSGLQSEANSKTFCEHPGLFLPVVQDWADNIAAGRANNATGKRLEPHTNLFP